MIKWRIYLNANNVLNSFNKNKDILIEIIRRFYGCKLILENNTSTEYFSSFSVQSEFEPHPNILPALCAVSIFFLTFSDLFI